MENKFFSWAWNHLIWHTDCSKNPLGVLSRVWKFFWYISMFQVIKISYWTIEKWIWKITFFSSMAYTKKIRKKVSPQKIPTGSLSLVHKSYMVTEDSLPFILPIIKITLQKWTVTCLNWLIDSTQWANPSEFKIMKNILVGFCGRSRRCHHLQTAAFRIEIHSTRFLTTWMI